MLEGSTFLSTTGREGRYSIDDFQGWFRLLVSDFIDKVIQEYGFSIHELNPNVVNKIVGFELGCRALGFSIHELTPNAAVCTPFKLIRRSLRRNGVIVGCGLTAIWSDLAILMRVKRDFFNSKDWPACVLAEAGISAAWRSHRMIPQFFVESDGKRYFLPPSSLFYFI